MTLLLCDVAVYQGDLQPADVKRAGFFGVNLKVSHGLGQQSVHPDVRQWVVDAATYGLAVSTFHFLTGEASGAAQAKYCFGRLRQLGLQYGTAHQVDCESDATEAILRDYLTTMTELAGRPPTVYSARWWWGSRGWKVADLTPFLWGVPNSGASGSAYPGTYPGDSSPLWSAGWGGFPTFSIMQYAVEPLIFPDGSRGAINVSKSAIRDPAVWTALTHGRTGLTFAPATLLQARQIYMDCLARAGYKIDPASVGIVGDDNHNATGSSYHLGKSALRSDSYTIVESARDKNGLSEAASALDLGYFKITVTGKAHDLRSFSLWLVAQCQAGASDTKDIREVIYSPDGKAVKRWDRLGKRTTGDDSHLSHTHISRYRDAENSTSLSALITRYFTEISALEDDMAEGLELDKTPVAYPKVEATNPTWTGWNALGYTRDRAHEAVDRIKTLQTAVAALQQTVTANQTALLAAVKALGGTVDLDDADIQAIITGVLAGLPQDQADRVVDALVNRVRTGTGGAA